MRTLGILSWGKQSSNCLVSEAGPSGNTKPARRPSVSVTWWGGPPLSCAASLLCSDAMRRAEPVRSISKPRTIRLCGLTGGGHFPLSCWYAAIAPSLCCWASHHSGHRFKVSDSDMSTACPRTYDAVGSINQCVNCLHQQRSILAANHWKINFPH